MPPVEKYRHDDKPLDQVTTLGSPATSRYVLVYVDNDNNLWPMIERKSNGQSFHMTYKVLSVATDTTYKIGVAQPDYDSRVAVYDRQYQTVL
jgi:hypothetical protein